MPQTSNKGYEVQVTSTNPGTWGDVLNDDTIAVIDLNMGGLVVKSLSSSNVTLTTNESRNAILRLTGTLLANVQITTECIGFFYVENLTSGAFDVTVRNTSVATAATVPQGTRASVLSDATNGCRIGSDSGVVSGTAMMFVQTAAPTGWTKSAAHNNKALRVVSGAASSGGSVDFTTAFASQAVTGTTDNTTLTIAQMPLHGHPTRVSEDDGGGSDQTGGMMLNNSTGGGGVNSYPAYTGAVSNTAGEQVGGTGGGQPHNHTFTGDAIDMDVQYVDVIIATKD